MTEPVLVTRDLKRSFTQGDVTIEVLRGVDLEVAAIALAAFDRYGRRSGHVANLNMGDCFAYAFARQRQARLLYKGKDFVHTDVHLGLRED